MYRIYAVVVGDGPQGEGVILPCGFRHTRSAALLQGADVMSGKESVPQGGGRPIMYAIVANAVSEELILLLPKAPEEGPPLPRP